MTKSQIEEDLRARAISLYVGPFNYYCGYISDSKGEVFADLGSIIEQEARIRGWCRIQKLEDAEALQDKVGELFAEALSQFWLAAKQDAESMAEQTRQPRIGDVQIGCAPTKEFLDIAPQN